MNENEKRSRMLSQDDDEEDDEDEDIPGEQKCLQCHHLVVSILRTVATFVTAHTFCASQDTRVSYGWCLLIQGYFYAV